MDKLTHYPMVIGEEWITTGSEDLIDPATGKVFATVALGTPAEVDRAVAAAKVAQPKWAALSYGERSLALLKFADALEAHSEELAKLESQNAGKPLKLSAGGDIPFSIDNLRYFASIVRRQEGVAAGEYVGGYTSLTRREPIGIVGAITPWNYPFMMAIWKLAPALAAGNAIVIKPRSQHAHYDDRAGKNCAGVRVACGTDQRGHRRSNRGRGNLHPCRYPHDQLHRQHPHRQAGRRAG